MTRTEETHQTKPTGRNDSATPVGPELIGPHNGGNVVINKRMEVEVRSKKTINEDLAPAGTGAVKF